MTLVPKVASARISFLQVFRIIFVIFFIYLTGNLYSLWFGYRDFASSGFLSSASLMFTLWSFMAVFAAVLVWLIFRTVERLCLVIGWEIRFEHLFVYIVVFLLIESLLWSGKKLLFPDVHMTLQLKLLAFMFGAIVSMIFAMFFHGKAERWVDIIQKRIAPLVWVFGICVVLSVPLTVYQTWQEMRIHMPGNRHSMGNEQPLVTFFFDDGYERTYTRAKSIFKAKDEVACAVITLDYIGKSGRMNATQIMELQNDGWEIVSHAVNHTKLTTLTGAEIENELEMSKKGLTALGFNIINLVYPFNRHNATVRKIARKYYRSARSGNEWKTGLNVNPFILRRYALSSVKLETPDQLAVLKGYVDYAEANNYWFMVVIHNVHPFGESMLNSLIDYIQAKGIKIVTLNQGLDLVADKEESIMAERLFFINHDSPANILRNVHIICQRLLRLFHDKLLIN